MRDLEEQNAFHSHCDLTPRELNSNSIWNCRLKFPRGIGAVSLNFEGKAPIPVSVGPGRAKRAAPLALDMTRESTELISHTEL